MANPTDEEAQGNNADYLPVGASAEKDDFVNAAEPKDAPEEEPGMPNSQPGAVDANGDEIYDASGKNPPRIPLLGQTSDDYLTNARKIANYEYAKNNFAYRQQQRAANKEFSRQRKDWNQKAKQDSAASGNQYEFNPEGVAQPRIDPVTGQQAVKQRVQPIQYEDATGKPYQVILNPGNQPGKTITNPDANAPIGQNPNDPNDPNLYRKNKFGTWDTIDPTEGIHSPDNTIAVTSAKQLHKTMLRDTLQKRTDLGLQIQQLRAGISTDDLDGSQSSTSEEDSGDGTSTPTSIPSGGLNSKARAKQEAIVDGNKDPIPKPAPKTTFFGGVNTEATAQANTQWQQEEQQRQATLAAAQKTLDADDQIKANRAQMLQLSLQANDLKKEGPAGVLKRLRAQKAQDIASLPPDQAQAEISSKVDEINQMDVANQQASDQLTKQMGDLQAARSKGGTAAQMAEWDNQSASLLAQQGTIQQQITARNAKASEVQSGVEKLNQNQAAQQQAAREKMRANPDTAPLADKLDALESDYATRKAQVDAEPDPAKRQVALDALHQDVNAKREQTVSDFTNEAQQKAHDRFSKTQQISALLQAHDKAKDEAQTKMSEYLGTTSTPLANTGIGPVPLMNDPIRGHLKDKLSEIDGQQDSKINDILKDADPAERAQIQKSAQILADVQTGKKDVAIVQGAPIFSDKINENPKLATAAIANALANGELDKDGAKAANAAIPAMQNQAAVTDIAQKNPGKVAPALYQAQAQGKLQPTFEQLQLAKQADDQYAEIAKAAGDMPGAKAFLKGLSIGAPAMAAFSRGGPIGANIGAKLPRPEFMAPVGYIIGGMAAACLVTFAARKGFDALGQYSDLVNSFNASAKITPMTENIGEIVGGAYGAPQSIANLSKLGKIAYSESLDYGATKAGAALGASKIIGSQIAKAAGAGIAMAVVIQPAFDASVYLGAQMLGLDVEKPQLPTMNSMLQMAGISVLLAAHGMAFKHYTAGEITSIMTRGKTRDNLGIPLDSADSQHQADILKSFEGLGAKIDNQSAEAFSKPLTTEETQLYKSLSKKYQAMRESGKFEGKNVDFASATQASIKTSGKDNVPILAGGVIAKDGAAGEPKPEEPPTGGQTPQGGLQASSAEQVPSSPPVDTPEKLHAQLARVVAAKQRPGITQEHLASLDHLSDAIGEKLEALGVPNPNKPKPEEVAVANHEIAQWAPPAEMKPDSAVVARNAAAAAVKILSGSQLADLTAAERAAMEQNLPGKEPRYEEVNGMPILTNGQLSELSSIAPSASRLIRMNEGQARAYANRIPLRAKFQKGGGDNGKTNQSGQGGRQETLTPSPKGDLAGAPGGASPTPVIPVGKTGTPLTQEEKAFSNEISSQLQSAGAKKVAADAFAAYHVRQEGAKGWTPEKVEAAKAAFEKSGGFTDPISLIRSIKASADSHAADVDAIHKKIVKGWGKQYTNLAENKRAPIDALLRERFIPEMLIYGKALQHAVGNPTYRGGAGIGVAKGQINFNLRDLAGFLSKGVTSAESMHSVEATDKTIEEEVGHIASEIVLASQRQGRHEEEKHLNDNQLALLESAEIFQGLPKVIQDHVRKIYETDTRETDAALGMEFLRMLLQHDVALDGGKLIDADGNVITEQTLEPGIFEKIKNFVRDLLKLFNDLRKSLHEMLSKEEKSAPEIEKFISRVESIRKETIDLFKSWKKQADESRAEKYAQEYERGNPIQSTTQGAANVAGTKKEIQSAVQGEVEPVETRSGKEGSGEQGSGAGVPSGPTSRSNHSSELSASHGIAAQTAKPPEAPETSAHGYEADVTYRKEKGSKETATETVRLDATTKQEAEAQRKQAALKYASRGIIKVSQLRAATEPLPPTSQASEIPPATNEGKATTPTADIIRVPVTENSKYKALATEKEIEAAELPAKDLTKFLNAQHEDLNHSKQRPMGDASLSRLLAYFHSIGDDDRAQVVFNEQGTREREGNLDEATEGKTEFLDVLRKLGGINIDDPVFKGDIGDIRTKDSSLFNRKNALPLDRLRSALEDHGFKFHTVADMVDAITHRLSEGGKEDWRSPADVDIQTRSRGNADQEQIDNEQKPIQRTASEDLADNLRASAGAIRQAQPGTSKRSAQIDAIRSSDAIPWRDPAQYGEADTVASEHEVWFYPENSTVVKATASGRFGHAFDYGHSSEGALPLDYIDRLNLSNRVFGDTTRVVGKFETPNGGLGLIHSQDFIPAHEDSPNPTKAQIGEFMESKGFVKSDKYSGRWINDELSVEIDDTHPGNFIVAKDGNVHPIDLLVRKIPQAQIQARKRKNNPKSIDAEENHDHTADMPEENRAADENGHPSPGGQSGEGYRISHRPMTDAGGASRLHDLTSVAFDDNIYGKNALQYYGSGDVREANVLRILKGLRGKPDADITIWRGVPDSTKEITPGDWVTLDKRVAEDYGNPISKVVKAKDVTAWGDSLLEFGYHPNFSAPSSGADVSANQSQNHVDDVTAQKYAQSVGASNIEEAINGISRTLAQIRDPRLAEDYQGDFTSQLFEGKEGTSPEGSPSADTLNADGTGRAEVSQQEYDSLVDRGLRGDWQALGKALVARGTASSIFKDLVGGNHPGVWDIVGTKIKSPADLAATLMPLRSPYVESLKVAVLDKNQKVVRTEIVSIGSLNESIAHPREIFASLARLNAEGHNYKDIILAHNHPSGNPEPSNADRRLTTQLHDAAAVMGYNVLDHVITNGESYYSFREVAKNQLPEQKLAQWEKIERSGLQNMDRPEYLDNAAAALRQGDPDAGHILILNTKLNLLGARRLADMAKMSPEDISREAIRACIDEGGYGFSLHLPGEDLKAQGDIISKIHNAANLMQLNLIDAATYFKDGTFRSWRETGHLFEEPTSRLNEDQLEFIFNSIPEDKPQADADAEKTALARFQTEMPETMRIAARYSNIPGVDMAEVQQTARLALAKAAKEFDPSREKPFGAMAGVYVNNALRSLYKREDIRRERFPKSLDEQISGEAEGLPTTRADVTPDTTTMSAPMAAAANESRQLLDDAISNLPQRMQSAVQGFKDGRMLTEIAKDMGVTKQAVNQLQKAAFERLRRALGLQGISEVDQLIGARRRGDLAEPEDLDKEIDDILAAINAEADDYQNAALAEEASGATRNIGRPDLAHGANNADVRGLDQLYTDKFKPETEEQWEKAAGDMLKRDYEGTRKEIEKAGFSNESISPELTKAADIIARDLLEKMLKTGSAEDRSAFNKFWYAYRSTGTAAGRALASRHDPLKTPQERHRDFLLEYMLKPRKAAQKEIDAEKNPEKKTALIDAEAQALFDKLKAAGITPDDILKDKVSLSLVYKNIRETFRQMLARGTDANKAAFDAILKNKSFAAIAKMTGLSETAVKKIKDDFIAAMRKDHFAKFKAGAKADGGALVTGKPVDDVSAEREFKKFLGNFGIVDDILQGKPKFDISDFAQVKRMAMAIREARGDSSLFDKAYEWMVEGMLSGPQTHVAIASSNLAAIAWDVTVQRGMESLVNLAVRDSKAAQIGEFKHLLNGIMPGISMAYNVSAKSWSAEHDFYQSSALGTPDELNSAVEFQRGSGGGHIPGKAGRIIRVPGRAILFMDSMFKVGMGKMEVGAQAYRMAKSEGLTGKPMENRIAQLSKTLGEVIEEYGPKVAVDPALAKHIANGMARRNSNLDANDLFADKESQAWTNARERAAENAAIKDGWTNAAWQRAYDKSMEVTFKQKLKTVKEGGNVIEDIAARIQDARSSNKLLSLIFPFVRTPYDIFRIGIRKSPLGALNFATQMAKGLWSLRDYKGTDGKTRKQFYLGEHPDFVRDLAEQLIAWGAMALLFKAVQGDKDDDDKKLLITGSTENKEDKRGEKELNTRAYGGGYVVRIGGRGGMTLPYGRIEPFVTVLGTTADAIRAAKRNGNQADQLHALWNYMLSQVNSKTFLQGINTVNEVVQGSKNPADYVKKFLLQALVPNIIRSPLRSWDDYVRNAKGASPIYTMLPAGSNAEARVDVYGNEVKKSGSPIVRLFVNTPLATDPVLNKTDKLLLAWNHANPQESWAPEEPKAIYKDAKGKNVDMTPEQAHKFELTAGRLASNQLKGIVNARNAENPTKADIDNIRHAFESARSQAKEMVVRTIR